MLQNPLKGWHVDRASIGFIGEGLQRPECILAERDGSIWTADARGGMVHIRPDGTQTLVTPVAARNEPGNARVIATNFENRYMQAQGSLPNGVCFDSRGDFIIANWGTDTLDHMTRTGDLRTLYRSIGGAPLGKANFPLRDRKNRIWLSVTTRQQPWTAQVNNRAHDGYIALVDERGIRIVAEGFCGTNELRFDKDEEWLYVVESTARRISRLRFQPDGSVAERENYGPSVLEGHPDGFAFDAHGNLWITLIFLDKLIAITPGREVITLLDDSNPAANAVYERHFAAGTITPEVMSANHGTLCPWMASLTFGGPDLRTVYLGSLRGDRVPFFRSPVAGEPMRHW
jgi:sugar lactone lactonase YvrE